MKNCNPEQQNSFFSNTSVYDSPLRLTNEGTSLLGLPLVIVHTIFEHVCDMHPIRGHALTGISQVHHDDIKAFRSLHLVAEGCRRESERLLFRTLTINYQTIIATRGDLHILNRLMKSPEDTLANNVRHLQIGPFTDYEYYNAMIALAVERAISKSTKLQSLSWHSHLPIPLTALQDLYESCPSAQLHVINCDRRFPVLLPRPLLSYPRLHTLEITVYYILQGLAPAYSELQNLKTA